MMLIVRAPHLHILSLGLVDRTLLAIKFHVATAVVFLAHDDDA